MPQEIYNEGRVVGLSAWEIFAKTKLDGGTPPEDIPNEREWLASMIGSGASMILRVPAHSSGVLDFELPENSNLTAAGAILATPFIGSCDWTDTAPYWAKRVKSYGRHLILNDSDDGYPSADGTSVPFYNTSPSAYSGVVKEYVKITDGIVYTKKARWAPIGGSPAAISPYEDIVDTNFNESTTVIRLYISDEIDVNVDILFTGFANKRIIEGFAAHAEDEGDHTVGGSCDIDNNDWKNGGMLGPEMIPWASKIIFSVPNLAYEGTSSLHRLIPSDQSYVAEKIANAYTFQYADHEVTSAPLIDFDSINLVDYYNEHASEFLGSVTLATSVSDNPSRCNYIVAWYPGMTAANINATKALTYDTEKKARFFPPAIYGQQISSNGNKTLVPLDVAAPGTVKGFTDSFQAYNYKNLMPDNYAIYHDTVNNTFSFAINNTDSASWPGTATITYESTGPLANILVGTKKVKALSFVNSSGIAYSTAGQAGTINKGPTVQSPENYICWNDMINALQNNKSVDTLGPWLRTIGLELSFNSATSIGSAHTLGLKDTLVGDSETSGHIDYIGSKYILLNPGSSADYYWTSPTHSIWLGSQTMSDDGLKYLRLNYGYNQDTHTDMNASIYLGTNFIRFTGTQNDPDGIKLYVSTVNPGTSGVPNNSIGLGW